MLKNIIVVFMIIMVLLFSMGRLQNTKSVLMANYFVLENVEKQNLETVLNAVRYYTPSYSFSSEKLFLTPYHNLNNQTEVYIGDCVSDSETITPYLSDKKCFLNNYLFRYDISYSNQDKKVEVLNISPNSGKIVSRNLVIDGEIYNVLELGR